MKKKIYHIFPLLLAVLVLMSCASKDKKYTIGISQCAMGFWRQQMNDEVRREALLNSDVEYKLLVSLDNSSNQIADIEGLISDGIDALIVSPNNATDLVPVIEKAYDSGIPVILVDRKIESDKYTTFVGTDNREVGEIAARYILSHKGTGVRIAEFMGDTGITPVQERHEGFASTLHESGSAFESYDCGWDQESALALFDSIRASGDIPDVIFCHNDNLTQGIKHVVQQYGVMVVGVDGLAVEGAQFILDGVLSASVAYPTCGTEAMKAAIGILHGEKAEREVKIPTFIVDNNNAHTIQVANNRANELTNDIDKLGNRLDEFLMRFNMQQLILFTSLAFIIVLIVLLVIVFRAYSTNKRLRKRIEKMANARISFFTNVSHDFRTPLTLIADPLRQLLSTTLDPHSTQLLNIANKNVTVLLRLINQVLDFRKYEEGKMQVRFSEFNLHEKLIEWTEIFTPLADSRHILYDVQCPEDVTMIADEEKIERLTYNILSNAFKYTPDGGKVSIHVQSSGADSIRLSFSDTGKGMSSKELSHIFEDFYQANVHYSGTGIGLALVKAFVDMHHGTVNVESQPEHGTTFIITLPLRQKGGMTVKGERSQVLDNLQQGAVLAAGGKTDYDTAETAAAPNRLQDASSLLIIDDSAEVRSYIRLQLQSQYTILEAEDGEQGISIAHEQVPDIIILDVMMPGISGIETAQRLKSDLSTSHIPILMLTASTSDDTQIDSYKCGADAFMQKPFNSHVLDARIANLIAANKKRQQRITSADATSSTSPTDSPSDDSLTPMDSRFIENIKRYILSHLEDSTLRVDDLCAEFALSHTQFYRKTKSLTGMGPNEFLRMLRLQKSKELLADPSLSITDITYAVGFSSPSYFTKCFRDVYGMTPSEYREKNG